MSKAKLHPCPFCGNGPDLEIFHPANEYYICCCCCGGRSGHAQTKADAIATWNTRDGQSLNDQIWCLIEIRRLIGDPTAKLMQSELIDKVRELVVKRDVQEYIERREAAKGEKA